MRLADLPPDPEPQQDTPKPAKKRKFDPTKVRKWCSDKEISQMRQGRVNGIDNCDLAAIMEGQAAKRIRDYSRPVRVWELDED